MITSRLRYSQFKMSQFKVVKPLGALTLNGLSHRASLLSYASREAIREAIKHHWLGDLIALTLPAKLRNANNQQTMTCLFLQ